MSEITSMTVKELSASLAEGKISSVEITQSYLKSIKENDEKIGGYISITEDEALATAKKADEILKSGKGNALTGIPAAIKDNICTKGIRTTCASKMLENFVPPYDATVSQKLKAETVPFLGKVNMDEFAMGSSTENSAFKLTRNPRNTQCVPGGSSGGSAAVVAANEAPFSLGSDTGGSIRQPAAFCGVVGMKPTYGRVSRYGLVAFASSLDQIGPLSKTVEDNAMVLNAIAGHDSKDATSVNVAVPDYTSEIGKGVKGMKVALLKEAMGEGIGDEVKTAILNAARVYEKMGAEIVELSMPSLEHALPAYYVISSAEASSNLARFDGVRYGYRSENYNDITELYNNSRSEGFGKEVKRRIMLGTFALSSGYYDAYYKKALQVRTLIMKDYEKIFKECSFILSPVAPTVAYKIGEKTSNPLEMYLGDICSVPVNIGGIPALSLPCGNDKNNMPIGMQLLGPAFSEAMLYGAGAAYERETGAYHTERGAF